MLFMPVMQVDADTAMGIDAHAFRKDGTPLTRTRPRTSRKRLTATDRAALFARVAQGQSVAAACAEAGVSVPTYYRWRQDRAAPSSRAASESDRLRQTIILAAKRVFFREGYGVSLETIAAEAGVARQTLYNQFGSKRELFGQVIQQVYGRLYQPVFLMTNADSVAGTLAGFARGLLQIILDPEYVALFRITVAEHRGLPEQPDTAPKLDVATVIPPFTHHLAAYLEGKISEGAIRPIDPAAVAESFFGACIGSARNRALMDLPQEPWERIEARLDAVVDIFVRGLAPPSDAPGS